MTKTNAIIAILLLLVVAGLGAALYKVRSSAFKSKLEPVHVAAAEIRGGLVVGTNYSDYAHRLQGLSSAILRAKESGASREAIKEYFAALDAYRDALELWGSKLEKPYYYGLPYGSGQYSPLLDAMAKKYAVSGKVSADGRENLRVHDAVIQEIWKRANTAIDNAHNSE